MHYVLPLNYFGSIGYFRHLLEPNSIIDIHEHFVKQTNRSRSEILSANGRIQLSIPVTKPNGSKTVMKDIVVSYATDWQRIHWKAIESAYASSAFFEDYAPDIEQLIFSKPFFLQEMNLSSIQLVNKWLDLNIEYQLSEQFIEGTDIIDLRNSNMDSAPTPSYYQLFATPDNFQTGLSVLDLIFSEGPMARKWLKP